MSNPFYKVLENLIGAATNRQHGLPKGVAKISTDDLEQLLDDWRRLDRLVRAAEVAPPTGPYEVVTQHYGTVQFVYSAEVIHSPKRWDYEQKFREKLNELVNKYAVVENDAFCCQGEGYQIQGEDRPQVEAAIKELTSYLARFKCVEFVS